MRQLLSAFILAVTFLLTGCGDNTFQTSDEPIKTSWSEVPNQYQRRADLMPNLVNIVKMGYTPKPNFAVENEKEISRPPSVSFDNVPVKPEVEQVFFGCIEAGVGQIIRVVDGEPFNELSNKPVVL